jgi:hypothetical protein
MARRSSSIDDKIDNAQGKVIRAKTRYDAAVADLRQLMEKTAAMQRDEIMKAVAGSNKSFEEILAFLKDNQGCK